MFSDIKIKEVQAKSILSKSKLPSCDYTINPYIGCEHGCVYCYAKFMARNMKIREPWGKFVWAKTNAPLVLRAQLKGIPEKSVIFFSSVTDPYQPAEMKYELTRKCLQELVSKGHQISILTKSNLVERDIDLLKKLDASVGMSLTGVDKAEDAISTEQRIRSLKQIHDAGIKTYAFIGPIFPKITKLEEILSKIDFVEMTYVDKLNIKGNWHEIKQFLLDNYPELLPEYDKIKDKSYWEDIRKQVRSLCKQSNIRAWFCY